MPVGTRKHCASERGFTLVELMIVVAIVGVLAAVATYGVAQYVNTSRAAEATRNLAAMEQGAKASYLVPTDVSGVGTGPFVQKFCASASCGSSNWSQYPPPRGVRKIPPNDPYNSFKMWQCLKFNVPEPQFFSYLYFDMCGDGPNAWAILIASGDLDGDGEASWYEIYERGSVNGEPYRARYAVSQPYE
jgi:type IV pilus assembly protein PilA